jgi:hypothetical protein
MFERFGAYILTINMTLSSNGTSASAEWLGGRGSVEGMCTEARVLDSRVQCTVFSRKSIASRP